MKTILLFDAKRKCPKCDGEAGAGFVGTGEHFPGHFFASTYAFETLMRTCKQCHFWWVELPIDAQKEIVEI
jgi:hypothetical protein